jgi:hypothetical protein
MIGFRSLGRWRPESLLEAADHLEEGRAVAHFGHLYHVPVVVAALRHAADQVRLGRTRAFETADRIFAQGWTFRAAGGEVVIQEKVATAVTYEQLDSIERLLDIYAVNMAVALTEVETALNELYAVIGAARRDPDARARPRRDVKASQTRRSARSIGSSFVLVSSHSPKKRDYQAASGVRSVILSDGPR